MQYHEYITITIPFAEVEEYLNRYAKEGYTLHSWHPCEMEAMQVSKGFDNEGSELRVQLYNVIMYLYVGPRATTNHELELNRIKHQLTELLDVGTSGPTGGAFFKDEIKRILEALAH